MINRVKEFNTKEVAKAKYTLKRSDEYSQELINVIALVPFTSPTQQTAEMLGVKQRTTRHFAKQAKDMALTPKKEPGKKMVNPPDWVLRLLDNFFMENKYQGSSIKDGRNYLTFFDLLSLVRKLLNPNVLFVNLFLRNSAKIPYNLTLCRCQHLSLDPLFNLPQSPASGNPFLATNVICSFNARFLPITNPTLKTSNLSPPLPQTSGSMIYRVLHSPP